MLKMMLISKAASITPPYKDGVFLLILDKKGFSSPTQVSEEDKFKIAEDIKLGLFCAQILKKYRININAYSEIKKSVEAEKKKPDTGEDDPETVKKRLDYGRSINSGYAIAPVAGMLKGISGSSVIPVPQ